MLSADKDVEELNEVSYVADENANGTATSENSTEASRKSNHTHYTTSTILLLGIYPSEIKPTFIQKLLSR